ncbi:MAG: phosphoadenosine phosphosulfate reductase family protein [Bacteroidaceae bacterium]|nr:phosphoadenosine phosphosulfate reductase family protein [Bacteroidaceae bacterium]
MDLRTLRTRQAWTLPQKIDHSLGVIEAFASWFDGKVYVSFSGGKDSVVMLSLVELIIPNVQCVFVMTGCESPSVCRFIREQQQHHNIEIIRPEKTLRQVFAEYGFPLVSKRTAHDIECVRRNPYCKSSRNKLWLGNPHHIPERWMYLLNEPYQVSARCCFWLKHQPAYEYHKRTGLNPYIGLLASESYQRTLGYIQQGGCNVFEVSGKNHPRSLPLAIWTDDDVWLINIHFKFLVCNLINCH